MSELVQVDELVGKFYTVTKDDETLKVKINLYKLLKRYGTDITSAVISIPLKSSIDYDKIPEEGELELDQIPTKFEIMSDGSDPDSIYQSNSKYEPKITRISDNG